MWWVFHSLATTRVTHYFRISIYPNAFLSRSQPHQICHSSSQLADLYRWYFSLWARFYWLSAKKEGNAIRQQTWNIFGQLLLRLFLYYDDFHHLLELKLDRKCKTLKWQYFLCIFEAFPLQFLTNLWQFFLSSKKVETIFHGYQMANPNFSDTPIYTFCIFAIFTPP